MLLRGLAGEAARLGPKVSLGANGWAIDGRSDGGVPGTNPLPLGLAIVGLCIGLPDLGDEDKGGFTIWREPC